MARAALKTVSYLAVFLTCVAAGFSFDLLMFGSADALTYLSTMAALLLLAPMAARRADAWMDSGEWEAELKQRRNAPCPHGVPGGITKDLCSECRTQRLQAEEERKAKEQVKTQEEVRRYETEMTAVRFNQDQYKTYIQRQGQNIDFLRSVPPQKFEDLVAEMFAVLGWAVQQTPYTNDSGMDAILLREDRKFLLECKRYGKDNVVGRPILNAFLGVMTAQKADGGFFVTTSRFSSPAEEFAVNNNIILVDSTRLILMMDEAYPPQADAEMLRLMCSVCSDIVDFQDVDSRKLFYEEERFCKNGHVVKRRNVALMLFNNLSAPETKPARPTLKKSYAPKRKSYRRYRRRN